MTRAWESLHFATLELVRSTPIKQRLVCAYRRHLVTLRAEQLPPAVREPFQHLMAMLQGVKPLRGEDAVSASVRKMSNQEADDCSTQIVEIYGVTCRELLDSAQSSASVGNSRGGERDSTPYGEPSLIARV